MSYYRTLATHSVAELSESEIGDLNFLLSSLSMTAAPLTEKTLSEILQHSVLAVVRHTDDDGSKVCGMGFMTPVCTATGYRMYVSDVAVSPAHPEAKVLRDIMGTLLAHATLLRATSVEFMCNVTHEEACVLYTTLGFKLCETNVYRFLIPQEESPDE